ncbi:MAG: heavy-metal-associated domain-containing protein [Melioribacteraceae bacterium]|nr:heavy-metal-associated domain-containing protein [Melioribacteraceae bacterium]
MNYNKIKNITILFLLLTLWSCSTPKVETKGPGLVSFKSSLTSETDVANLKKNLTSEPGVKEIDIHLGINVIMISFDRKLNSVENFKKLIEKAGFKAEEIKAKKKGTDLSR